MAIGNNLPVGEKLIKNTTRVEKENSIKVESEKSIKDEQDLIQISLWLPKDLVRRMKTKAIEKDIFYSEVMQSALEKYLS
jgi:hypothetical protein